MATVYGDAADLRRANVPLRPCQEAVVLDDEELDPVKYGFRGAASSGSDGIGDGMG
jgi:hypothetical protein